MICIFTIDQTQLTCQSQFGTRLTYLLVAVAIAFGIAVVVAVDISGIAVGARRISHYEDRTNDVEATASKMAIAAATTAATVTTGNNSSNSNINHNNSNDHSSKQQQVRLMTNYDHIILDLALLGNNRAGKQATNQQPTNNQTTYQAAKQQSCFRTTTSAN